MSHLSEIAKGTILLADYVNVDPMGKVNIIGGGIQFMGFDPETGMSTPFSLFVSLSASPAPGQDRHAAMEIVLVDLDGHAIELPGPAGMQAMRVSQNVEFTSVTPPGAPAPPTGFPSTANMAMNFVNGLPLAPGRTYEWVVQLDHDLISKVAFHVPGPTPGPVIG